MNSDSPVVIRSSVCAFVDILGQKIELAKFEDLPIESNLAGDPEFEELIDNTFRRVHFFHRSISEFITRMQAVAGKSIPGSIGDYIRRLTSTSIEIKPFSDGIFLAHPLTLDQETSPIHGVACMLGGCASAMLQNLATETAIRGGVEIGTIADIGLNVFCGPGVAEAHRLEEEVAKYPRIIVGKKLVSYILATCEMTAADASRLPHVTNPEVFAKVAAAAARVCKEMVLEDYDGNYIVHYLSPRTLSSLGEELTGTLVKHARAFVVAQEKVWREEGDQNLLERYSHLLDYFNRYANE